MIGEHAFDRGVEPEHPRQESRVGRDRRVRIEDADVTLSFAMVLEGRIAQELRRAANRHFEIIMRGDADTSTAQIRSHCGAGARLSFAANA